MMKFVVLVFVIPNFLSDRIRFQIAEEKWESIVCFIPSLFNFPLSRRDNLQLDKESFSYGGHGRFFVE